MRRAVLVFYVHELKSGWVEMKVITEKLCAIPKKKTPAKKIPKFHLFFRCFHPARPDNRLCCSVEILQYVLAAWLAHACLPACLIDSLPD